VEFRTPFGRDGCGGAIVVWTRIGPDEWDDRREPEKEDVQRHLPIYAVEEVDVPAALDSTAMVAPVYPDSARAFDLEGAAVVEFVVDTTGRPVYSSIRAVSANDPQFGAAAERAVAFSRFVPARKAGQAVRQRMSLTFRFTTDPEP
jgi:TonB family protein